MLANIVHSFEYGQLSTHKNVGVQEMTSVAPRHLSQSCAQRTATLYSYCSYFTQYPLSDSIKGIAFKTMGSNVLSPLYNNSFTIIIIIVSVQWYIS